MIKCFPRTLFLVLASVFMMATSDGAVAIESTNNAAQTFAGQPEASGKPLAEPGRQEICRPISFEQADLVLGFINDTYLLGVAGRKPYINMRVELWPKIYVTQPDYWQIEVVGCIGQIGLPAEVPYAVEMWVTHFMGKKGVEVIGKDGQSKTLDK